MSRKALPKSIRDAVKNKYGGHCAYCGQKPEKLCIDHFHPIQKAHWLEREGKDVNDISNLMPACFSCNNYKLSHSLEVFREGIKDQIWQGRKHSLAFRLSEKFGLIQVTNKPVVFYFEQANTPEPKDEKEGL